MCEWPVLTCVHECEFVSLSAPGSRAFTVLCPPLRSARRQTCRRQLARRCRGACRGACANGGTCTTRLPRERAICAARGMTDCRRDCGRQPSGLLAAHSSNGCFGAGAGLREEQVQGCGRNRCRVAGGARPSRGWKARGRARQLRCCCGNSSGLATAAVSAAVLGVLGWSSVAANAVRASAGPFLFVPGGEWMALALGDARLLSCCSGDANPDGHTGMRMQLAACYEALTGVEKYVRGMGTACSLQALPPLLTPVCTMATASGPHTHAHKHHKQGELVWDWLWQQLPPHMCYAMQCRVWHALLHVGSAELLFVRQDCKPASASCQLPLLHCHGHSSTRYSCRLALQAGMQVMRVFHRIRC